MELSKKKVLVFGTGKSGIGAAGLLLQKGASVVLYDGNQEKNADELRVQFAADAALEIVLGTLPESVMDTLDRTFVFLLDPCSLVFGSCSV